MEIKYSPSKCIIIKSSKPYNCFKISGNENFTAASRRQYKGDKSDFNAQVPFDETYLESDEFNDNGGICDVEVSNRFYNRLIGISIQSSWIQKYHWIMQDS